MNGLIYRITYNDVRHRAEFHLKDGTVCDAEMTRDEFDELVKTGKITEVFNIKFIIVGKGASGKDWLQTRFIEKGYKPMKQYTSRPVRDSEKGDEYHFVSDHEFKEKMNKGDFISANFYAIGWYGVSLSELMDSDVAILSPANVRDLFTKNPSLRKFFTIIYLDIPIETRRNRLSFRYSQKVDDTVERRINADEKDFQDFSDFDFRLATENDIKNFVNMLSENK